MRNVISAEWTKLQPHRGTWLLVWIYPIALLAFLTIGIFVKLASGGEPATVMKAAAWIDQSANIWYLPRISFGRYLIAAYVALVFAGEYGWNTWKLIVPHSARWKLVAAKYVVVVAMLYAAWFAAAVIAVSLDLLKAQVTGLGVPQGVTAAAVLNGHFALIVQGFLPVLVTAGYASLAAVLTRSTLAAFIISIVLVTLDQTFGMIVRLLSGYGMEWLTYLYRVLPGYHLENLTNWLQEGIPFEAKFAGGTVISYSLTVSVLVLTAWIVGLGALVFTAFRRQDIN